jgi:hypothetical protein
MGTAADLNEVKGLNEHSVWPYLPDFRKVEVLVKDSRGAPPQRTPASPGGVGLGLEPGGSPTPVADAPALSVKHRGDGRYAAR